MNNIKLQNILVFKERKKIIPPQRNDEGNEEFRLV